MDQFSSWSGKAHALLRKHAPKIRLGHVHQLLAAFLGHQTYASLRAADLATLNRKAAHYVIFNVGAALARAKELELPVTEELWWEVISSLTPSGITPFWLIELPGMHRAAELTFEDSFDPRLRAIMDAIHSRDNPRATSVAVTREKTNSRISFDLTWKGKCTAGTWMSTLEYPWPRWWSSRRSGSACTGMGYSFRLSAAESPGRESRMTTSSSSSRSVGALLGAPQCLTSVPPPAATGPPERNCFSNTQAACQRL